MTVITRSQSQRQSQCQRQGQNESQREVYSSTVKRKVDMTAAWRGAALKREKIHKAKLARIAGKVAAAARRAENNQSKLYLCLFFGKLLCNMLISMTIFMMLFNVTIVYGVAFVDGMMIKDDYLNV